jgi:transposase
MPESPTRYVGMDVHTESLAVAYVARAHDAQVMYLGTLSTRQADLAQLIRQLHSKTKHLVFVDEAGPCGDWLYRYLSKKGYVGWVVAPSLMPQKAADRVTTDRRDAVPWARFMRSGDRTPVYVPTVAELGDLTRVATPRQLMKYLGLIPSEYSTGARRRQGTMTKAGNTHARRALVAGAGAYRYPAKVSRHLPLRLETPPNVIQDSNGAGRSDRSQGLAGGAHVPAARPAAERCGQSTAAR